MAKKKFRTCIRLTIIKDVNDKNLEGYKEMIERGQPDFIEVKGYMHVGASQKFLEKENMPLMDYVQEFTKKILPYLPDYELVDEHIPSRVTLLVKKSSKKFRYIDFPKFFELANSKGTANIEDYGSEKMCPNS